MNDGKKIQVKELIGDKNIKVDVINIANDANNYLPFENNIKYKLIRFMQVSKIIKKSMIIFLNNPIFVSIEEYWSYKKVNKIKAL